MAYVTNRITGIFISPIRRFLFVSNTIPLRNSSSVNEPEWIPKDESTHTHQKWDKDDYRLARFIDKPKHVNNNFAINLIAEVPPAICKERVVWCDGGGGPTGHPKVFINLDKPGNHICGYCGLRFVKDTCHH